ncbi:MAG: hypothetical protein WC975_11605 [Phycisphaerae bacterium]
MPVESVYTPIEEVSLPNPQKKKIHCISSDSLLGKFYGLLFHHALWPLMNIANQRNIHKKINFLEDSQWWQSDQLKEYQLKKLRRLIKQAYENVPYYRQEMMRLHLKPEDFTSLDVLREMPTVTKSILKSKPSEFLAKGSRFQDLVIGTTSGSTGQPTTFYRTREQDSWHWALKYRMWGMAGYKLGDPYINVYNMARRSLKKKIQDFFLRNHDLYIFENADQEELFNHILKLFKLPSIKYLAGCTTTIRMLADYCAFKSIPVGNYLRAVLSTGSLLTKSEREFIENSLGVPVWDHYGLGGEGAHVAAECEMKKGYHVNVENLIVEPTEPGKVNTGESTGIIVTTLDNFGWPLIRYETGDAAVFTTRQCSCGRGLPLLERIDGRVSEIITLPNGVRLNVHYFSVTIGKSNNISQYQVEQKNKNELCIRIVWVNHQPSVSTKNHILSSLRKMCKDDLKIYFEDVKEIPLPKSGKHSYVIAYSRS